jgi:hypothetical protein
VTIRQTGDQPWWAYFSSPSSMAIGPTGILATDGNHFWVGVPTVG